MMDCARQLLTVLLDALSGVIRRVVGRQRVAILVYHKITPELFEAHVSRLVRLYNILPLDVLVDAIRKRDQSSMPPRSLILTFDDGLREFADLEPIIRRYKLPVTHYLPASTVGTCRRLWFWNTPLDVRHALKRLSNEARLAELKEVFGYAPDREYTRREALSLEEIRRLADAGVQFGGHTVTHPELPLCDAQTAWNEIYGGREDLQRKLGLPITHFAYPSGNYSLRDVELVKSAGFTSARTMDRGWNDVHTDLYLLKDISPGDDLSPSQIGHIELISLVRRAAKFLRWLREGVTEHSPAATMEPVAGGNRVLPAVLNERELSSETPVHR